jgi:uncharacterized protein
MSDSNKVQWYIDGLHFQCTQCGNCCSGPDEGFIWLTKDEIGFIADFLKITPAQLENQYLVRIGSRVSIIESRPSNDCIFLDKVDGQKKCRIYSVRPNQCRTWPFWRSNLTSANAWNEAAQRCPGVNRGRSFSVQEIEQKRDQSKWW